MSLKQRLIEQIAQEGPITVAEYMTRCLFDPMDGYYSTRPALGAEGDFITAPMVSQMFGEMIGIWVAQIWHGLGCPSPFRLVEIGGGDGTLMSDIVRVITRVDGMAEAAQVLMVEPSTPLRELQQRHIPTAEFERSVEGIPINQPLIIIANEVLDCLPARQFVRTDDGWHERRIGLIDGNLAFGLVAVGPDFAPPGEVQPGEIIEVSPAQLRFTRQLCELVRSANGAALLIDYGPDAAATGDTLQALHRHQKTDPLEAPGEHDITVWADFPSIRDTAVKTGVKASSIFSQRRFLHALGIEERLKRLQSMNPDHADMLLRQYDRLCDANQMGELFKIFAFAWPPEIALAGLEDEDGAA